MSLKGVLLYFSYLRNWIVCGVISWHGQQRPPRVSCSKVTLEADWETMWDHWVTRPRTPRCSMWSNMFLQFHSMFSANELNIHSTCPVPGIWRDYVEACHECVPNMTIILGFSQGPCPPPPIPIKGTWVLRVASVLRWAQMRHVWRSWAYDLPVGSSGRDRVPGSEARH